MPEDPPISLGLKIWIAFCGVIAVAWLGLLAWAVIRLVNHFT